jgi:glycosyltransferase involved in cell wall biosynthesis
LYPRIKDVPGAKVTRAHLSEAGSVFHARGARIDNQQRQLLQGAATAGFEETVSLPGASKSMSQEARCVFYDAGLLLHFGLKPPVGIVRVEQYLAEYLMKEAPFNLRFVTFDGTLKAYRLLRPSEQALLEDVLFRRYQSRRAGDETNAEGADGALTMRLRKVWGRLKTAARVSGRDFGVILGRDLGRLLPVDQDDPFLRRLATRVLRRSLFVAARLGHLVLSQLRLLVLKHGYRVGIGSGRGVGAYSFASGDTVISVANAWDYMDYDYLTDIVRRDGVKLVGVIHDVIAMEMPFTTPAPLHIYHRHWVELGHLAAHLVAISKYSLSSYSRLIGEPNDLDPPMSQAYLPNFLYERRDEIGETAVPELLGRRFVVFCSTIETRKNHILLLNLWDRLRQEMDPDTLPVLVFVGSWGWGTETVRLFSDRNWRLRKHLRILSTISDAELIWLYRNARFTVFPALAEGFGLAAAESLSFGTPVVVSNCPALLEASEELMPAYDPHDFPGWLAEMRRLILDEEYLASLRSKVAQYKGAGYDDFARAILDVCIEEASRSDVVAAGEGGEAGA